MTEEIPQQPTIEPKPRKPGTFTSETARIARAMPKRIPREPVDAASAWMLDPYIRKRVACTREQIEMLDARLRDAVKPAEIKAICESIARLTEVERKLSMRPDPGQNRPGVPAKSRSGGPRAMPAPPTCAPEPTAGSVPDAA